MQDESTLIHKLEAEKKSIDDKHEKLVVFISQHGDEVKTDQLMAMNAQQSAMFVYSYALAARIELLKK